MYYCDERERAYLQPLSSEFSDLLENSTSGQAMQKLLNEFEFNNVLDLGCGAGWHTRHFAKRGKKVTALDYRQHERLDISELEKFNVEFVFQDVMEYSSEGLVDALWCSHVLEHQLNPNLFLIKLHSLLKEEGVLAITVPPLKHEIVGGHVTLWNAGLLLYHLVLAGFDCASASILRYGYNISVIVKKRSIALPKEIGFCNGDIEKLAQYLPTGKLTQGFNGDIAEHNWY